MSPAATLERVQYRAYTTLAESVKLHASVRRAPKSPVSVERAWRVVGGVKGLVAFAEPAFVETLGPASEGIVADAFRDVHRQLREVLRFSAQSGQAMTPWYVALANAVEELADTIEGLDLSADPEMRAAIEAAVAELEAARATHPAAAPVDWRDVLAQMSD